MFEVLKDAGQANRLQNVGLHDNVALKNPIFQAMP